MKVKIYSEEEPQKKELLVKLTDEYGDVELVACDAAGKVLPDGRIATIKENGIHLWPYVSSSLGLPITSDSKVELV